jgi:hypothetical protein
VSLLRKRPYLDFVWPFRGIGFLLTRATCCSVVAGLSPVVCSDLWLASPESGGPEKGVETEVSDSKGGLGVSTESFEPVGESDKAHEDSGNSAAPNVGKFIPNINKDNVKAMMIQDGRWIRRI